MHSKRLNSQFFFEYPNWLIFLDQAKLLNFGACILVSLRSVSQTKLDNFAQNKNQTKFGYCQKIAKLNARCRN